MMTSVQVRTPGEMVDETTKRAVRAQRTGTSVLDMESYLSLTMLLTTARGENQSAIDDAAQELQRLNDLIWQAIDVVTGFDAGAEHSTKEWRDYAYTAKSVQWLNKQRTDKIREIDRLCGVKSTVPEKVHKEVG